MTPEQIAARKKVVQALMGGRLEDKPIHSKGFLERLLTETWPAKAANSALSALMAPGNAYRSTAENPVTTEQMVEPAANLAGLIGGTAFMAPAQRNAVGVGLRSYMGGATLDDIVTRLETGPLYARWSRGPRYDLRPGAVSRDYQSGATHDGLSAIELSNDLSRDRLLRFINDYSFLRAKDKDIRSHLYEAKRIGVDTDGAPTIRPTKYIGTISDDAISFMDDPANFDRLSLMDAIEQNKRALRFYEKNPPDYIPTWTTQSLREMEGKLADLGGAVTVPTPFIRR